MSAQYKFALSITCCLILLIKQETLTLNSVLDLNGTFPYLINKTSGQIIEPRDYMDFDNIYTPNATYRAHQTAQGRNYHLLKAFDFANYYQSDYWHYSSEEDLKLSAKPVADVNKCTRHLDWLERQLNDSSTLFKRGEQHINLMTLVDSFGRPEATTYYGHGYWLGSHYQCTRVQIDLARFEYEECLSRGGNKTECQRIEKNIATSEWVSSQQSPSAASKIKGRYCIGKARDIDWPNEKDDNYIPTITYKVGLCLPETCETLSFLKHRDQITRIMQMNLPDYLKSRIYLHDMYCLPDSRSPIRSLGFSSRIFLGLCAFWLLGLVAATAVYSCYKNNQRDLKNIIIAEQVHRELQVTRQLIENETKLKGTLMEANAVNEPSLTVRSAVPERQYINYMICNQSDTMTSLKGLNCGTQMLLISPKTPATLNHSTIPIENPTLNHHLTQSSPGLIGQYHHQYGPPANLSLSESGPAQIGSIASSTSTSSFSSWLNLAGSPMIIRILQALSIVENLVEFQQPPKMLRQPGSAKRLRINLNALDSIKCLCCILVIFGHIIFIHMQHLSNIIHTIELSHEFYPRLLIAFFNFVDTFFIISGMLTAYFVFKRFNKNTFGKPLVWISISLFRLIRLSPVYILVLWFAKTMTVHLSEGPVWDYGTDKNSIKGLCINDHWWKSILYLGNFGTMQPLCILPAWSIIVDAQYSLVLPPVLYLIFKHKRLGYILLLIAVVLTTANMSLQLATQTAVKTSDMAKIRLHVYPLISRFAAEFYNTAWNRIGPVAIGIMGGHMLHLYDKKTIRTWPWFMKGAAFKFILLLHLIIFILPTIGRLTDNPESTNETDLTIFVLSNATIKPIWSLINTIFLLRLVTDLRVSSVLARLMSHNIWHCLGKLCFASYLIHYEVILVLLKSRQEGLVDLNWSNVLREFSAAFLISTAISYLVHILYEAPINKLITLAFTKPDYMKKDNEVTVERSLNQDHDDTSMVKCQHDEHIGQQESIRS